jgi:hypothetical protein
MAGMFRPEPIPVEVTSVLLEAGVLAGLELDEIGVLIGSYEILCATLRKVSTAREQT